MPWPKQRVASRRLMPAVPELGSAVVVFAGLAACDLLAAAIHVARGRPAANVLLGLAVTAALCALIGALFSRKHRRILAATGSPPAAAGDMVPDAEARRSGRLIGLSGAGAGVAGLSTEWAAGAGAGLLLAGAAVLLLQRAQIARWEASTGKRLVRTTGRGFAWAATYAVDP